MTPPLPRLPLQAAAEEKHHQTTQQPGPRPVEVVHAPKGFLYESFTHGRVRSYYLGGGGRPSTSASIELYGKRGALVHCVQFCWKLHMDAFPGSECHVAGLMGESVQPV